MKISKFRGDLTDISAKTATLDASDAQTLWALPKYMDTTGILSQLHRNLSICQRHAYTCKPRICFWALMCVALEFWPLYCRHWVSYIAVGRGTYRRKLVCGLVMYSLCLVAEWKERSYRCIICAVELNRQNFNGGITHAEFLWRNCNGWNIHAELPRRNNNGWITDTDLSRRNFNGWNTYASFLRRTYVSVIVAVELRLLHYSGGIVTSELYGGGVITVKSVMCVSAWQTHPRSTSAEYIHRHRLHHHREALTSDTTICAKLSSAVAIPPEQLRVVCFAWKVKRKPSNAKTRMYACLTVDACAPRVFDFKRKP